MGLRDKQTTMYKTEKEKDILYSTESYSHQLVMTFK